MFTRLKNISQFGMMTVTASVMLINQVTASDAFKGDALYQQQQFEQALTVYLTAAEVGSPHVYYQLGTMYFKGQGTEPDTLTALLWFSLAAEYQFNDSANIIRQIMQNIDDKKKNDINKLINDFKQKYGKQYVENKYLPEIITANLNKKVIFDASNIFKFKMAHQGGSMDPIIFSRIPDRKTSLLFYLALLDYDVAPDGSRRNMLKAHYTGGEKLMERTMFSLSLTPLPQPTFEGKYINFMHRLHLGASLPSIDHSYMFRKHKTLYLWAKGKIKQLKEGNTSQDKYKYKYKYKYAIMLMLCPWYPQEEGEAVSLLKSLAEQGHVNSQYEYGLYLYREQIAPAEGIKWLSLASQFGLARSQ